MMVGTPVVDTGVARHDVVGTAGAAPACEPGQAGVVSELVPLDRCRPARRWVP